MSTHAAIKEILNRWPSRRAVLDDVNRDLPEDQKVEFIAVHRWFQRGSVNSKYDAALIDGASRRGISLTWRELNNARIKHNDQDGHLPCAVQPEGKGNQK